MGAEPRRARRAVALAALLVALLALGAAPAAADVVWRIDAVHGPQDVAPGGVAQYVVQAYNAGDADSSGGYTIVDALPPGMTVRSLADIPSDVSNGGPWNCSATGAFPAATVVCSETAPVPAHNANGSPDGGADPLLLTVHADAAAPGTTADDTATISGGGAAGSATAIDPTPFSTAPAGFGLVPGSVVAGAFDGAAPGGAPARQAGSHPFELRVDFAANLTLRSDPATGGTLFTEPDGHLRTLVTALPPGLVGNPQAVPQCDPAQLNDGGPDNFGSCPAATQVGTADLVLQEGTALHPVNGTTSVPVFNMAPPPGAIAQLAVSLLGNPAFVTISLDPANHDAVLATLHETTELALLRSARLTLWGVPGDPAHDPLRVDPASGYGAAVGPPYRPFLTLPSHCGDAGAIGLSAASWQDPASFTAPQTGGDLQPVRCADPRFAFAPALSVQPESHTPSTPTGLDVEVAVPQQNDAVGDATQLYAASGDEAAIATPPLRDATVTLPAGMAISPSSANGLTACTQAQIALGSAAAPACPDASKIGSAELQTPLLAQPVPGSIYLAAQSDNPFGSLLALYVVLRDDQRGIAIKLPGQVAPDPLTGQLTTTFADNPQLPFSRLRLRFFDGPRAALVTPPACGRYQSTSTLTSWNEELRSVHPSDAFAIDAGCAPRGFAPTFAAGTTDPRAGRDTTFVTRVVRGDGDQELGALGVSLPPGLIGRIASTVLCPDAAANAGTCTDASLIGSAIVAAGPGPEPFFVSAGKVFVTGPYAGAPFGLAIVVHAQAGPLDLGNVVVRAQIRVDRRTAALRIVTDPLPQILQGIPLELRVAEVTVDRPGFVRNPTNCAPASIAARISSAQGAVANAGVPFRAVECAALPFAPRLSLTVGARRHTARGATTPLTARLRMSAGQANLRAVSVTLPATLNARLGVLNRACSLAAFEAGRCGSGARAGSAVAVTPLLRDPLRGPAYFVKVPHRALPDLVVALRGQVAVDLFGKVSVIGSRRLATQFDTIPDVPVSLFSLKLVAGANAPLGTVANLCSAASRRAQARVGFRAQSGKRTAVRQRLRVSGCPARSRR